MNRCPICKKLIWFWQETINVHEEPAHNDCFWINHWKFLEETKLEKERKVLERHNL